MLNLTPANSFTSISRDVLSRNPGEITSACPLFSEHNYADRFPRPTKGARGQGIRFEKKVQKVLTAQYTGFISTLPFRYHGSKTGVILPDGLLLYKGELFVIEIKLRHCAEAWYQLRKMYKPVIETAFQQRVRMLEICCFFVPEIRFPEPLHIVKDFATFASSSSELGCWVWGR